MTKGQREQLRNLKRLNAEMSNNSNKKESSIAVARPVTPDTAGMGEGHQFAKDLTASVKEAIEIKRGKRPASRFFTVNLCKDQEIARSPGMLAYKLDMPVDVAVGDTMEIHIDVNHSEKA